MGASVKSIELRISKLANRSIEITQTKAQKGRNSEKLTIREHLRAVRQYLMLRIHVIGILEGKETENGQKQYLMS